jgi:hypothetical protein
MAISVTTWVAAGAIALALGVAGVQTVRLAHEQAAHANTRAEFADERVAAAFETTRAMAEERDEFERRIGEKDENIKAAQDLAAARGTALANARRAGDGLQVDLAAAIARAGQAGRNPDAGPGGETAASAARVLGELFAEADGFAGIVAGALAASRDAGVTCERSYDSLTTK